MFGGLGWQVKKIVPAPLLNVQRYQDITMQHGAKLGKTLVP